MPPKRVIADDAPRTDNPYSQGVAAGDMLYVSGHGPVDPETGEEIDGNVKAQTDHVLDNVAAVVSETGDDGLDDTVKLTMHVTNLDDYERVNEAYGARSDEVPPTRICVEMTRLPGDVRVKMDAIAYLG